MSCPYSMRLLPCAKAVASSAGWSPLQWWAQIIATCVKRNVLSMREGLICHGNPVHLRCGCPCRMEPLVMVDAEKRKPMYVPYYRGGRRLHIGMAEFAEDVGGGVSRAAMATSGAVVGG